MPMVLLAHLFRFKSRLPCLGVGQDSEGPATERVRGDACVSRRELLIYLAAAIGCVNALKACGSQEWEASPSLFAEWGVAVVVFLW